MKAAIFILGTVALGIGLWGSLSPPSSPPTRTDDSQAALMASYLVDGTRTHFSADGSASDVLIIDGSRYHGVAPLRSLPGTQFKSQPLRHSLVHFTRSMHMERGSGRGEGGYWAEPEGGLQRTRLRTTEKAGPT